MAQLLAVNEMPLGQILAFFSTYCPLEWTSILVLYWRTRPWGWTKAIWVAHPLKDKLIFCSGFRIWMAKFGPIFTMIPWDNWNGQRKYSLKIWVNHEKKYKNGYVKAFILQKIDHFIHRILDSIVVSIPACHAGDRGSIPRRGGFFCFAINLCYSCNERRW